MRHDLAEAWVNGAGTPGAIWLGKIIKEQARTRGGVLVPSAPIDPLYEFYGRSVPNDLEKYTWNTETLNEIMDWYWYVYIWVNRFKVFHHGLYLL